MMQRKKHGGSSGALHSISDENNADDGGSAKQKTSHLPMRLRVAFASSSSSTSSSTRTKSRNDICCPDVPVVLKLIILSFLGFAILVVLTAKGRHEHWRYDNVIRSAHMPVPLMDAIKHSKEKGKVGGGSRIQSNSGKSESSHDASQRMLEQPSRFVDSEKKLKKQLQQLLEKQNAEKKKHVTDPNKSVLGIKISNRYLGEDLLPYPESKGNEVEWEKKMGIRKKELTKRDTGEWDEMMKRNYEIMNEYAEENEHADHALGSHADESTDQRIDEAKIEKKVESSANNNVAIHPPKGTDKWPSPSEKAGPETTILLKPAFGSHRPSQDAILIFAEGYDLSIYLAFVESLISTGFDGDLVISISSEDKLKPDVKEYLQSKDLDTHGINVVAYEVNWSCFTQKGEVASGSREGINHCQMNDAFGDAAGKPILDPREPRPVATARYELYWMWALQYNKESWLMLIDARDVWFQLHPFKDLTSKGKVSGELHLFGENAEVVNIGSSSFNKKWLITAYGQKAVQPYFDKQIVCSGSTIGNQDALETYLRAMVAQYDATLCKQKGCDQGFHNYLYYSGQLGTVESDMTKIEGISKLIVHDQGKGIINNLGALRTKPLTEWGLYDAKKELVLNWDGTTSAVAHQYDRDKEANIMVKKKKKQFERDWKSSKNR